MIQDNNGEAGDLRITLTTRLVWTDEKTFTELALDFYFPAIPSIGDHVDIWYILQDAEYVDDEPSNQQQAQIEGGSWIVKKIFWQIDDGRIFPEVILENELETDYPLYDKGFGDALTDYYKKNQN